MVAELSNNAPFDYGKAKIFAERHNLTVRSVISKVKSLGLEYVKAVPAPKKAVQGPTKAQVLAEIRAKLALPNREGDLTKAELEAILSSL
jgi:hypothetical protein